MFTVIPKDEKFACRKHKCVKIKNFPCDPFKYNKVYSYAFIYMDVL